ncbi:class I SAM-dependent methyltransferase [Nonomuraea sp. NPDC049152]|uniref:class I SAM-dependent methyltransferase n=1 Tax=Nonomuraea sp. NPDC049152 TaxID=3154350 RepID=UPI0033DFBC91
MNDYLDVNRANWDERVAIHVGSEFYDVAGFKAGEQPLRAFELAEMGDVRGRRLVHLQCHFGLDTLAWARLGADVTGVDFSGKAVEAARAIAAECGIDARFVEADVYDAAPAAGDGYDIVYTGIGALVWLPDLDRWARVVAGLLKPGGFLYLAEFHPFGDVLDYEDGSRVAFDYFDRAPQVEDFPHTYTGSEVLENTTSVQFAHGIGEVVTALAGAGLRVEFLHEHDFTLFRRFGSLEPHGPLFRFPEGRPGVPLLYSLRARRDR